MNTMKHSPKGQQGLPSPPPEPTKAEEEKAVVKEKA